jgi:pimeloyl-ACP methyl ester carboxylesterase
MAQILLIPGLLCDETVWQPLLAQLGGKAAVADLSTQDDLTTMAQDCLAAHPGKLRIAGHSMGARVAMEMARAAPGRIERLALLDTGMHPLKEGERERRAGIVRFAHDRGMAALAERWLPGMVHAPNREDAALMRSLTDMVLAKDADLHERQITALVNRPDASAYLGSITCPVLLVVGEEDQWSPVAQHAEMARLLPRPRLEVIPGAGHFAPLEQPEAVAGLVAEFLTGEG